ncbi:MAG: GTP-binding protein [Candidatus Lokiarchaeota archaeon]|nr:GTP-binding protein [Candidatus Lokiarchaeota archaeon]
MLRQVFIVLNNKLVYQRSYAKGLEISLFTKVIEKVKKVALSKFSSETGNYDFFEYKLSYIIDIDFNLIILFVSGMGDDFKVIETQLKKFKNEFTEFYGDTVKDENFEIINEALDPIVDAIHRNMKPKISIVGFSGVGKTTTTKLIKSEEIPMQHIPTITGEVATIKIGKLSFFLWDFAGQEQFDFLWEKFIDGSDAVLLLTDSTLENLEKSRYFFELVNKVIPYARLGIIANKQDLPEAMKVEEIERLMGNKTYSMVAIDPNNRSKMIRIIADLLDMDTRVSPLLQPIFERDSLMDKAQKILEQGEFEEAVSIFKKISNLCLELGDDSLALDFQNKSQKISKIIDSFANN